jgi:hypothetical protein
MLSITPIEWEAYQRVLAYLSHPHNHPAFPVSKPTEDSKALLSEVIKASGLLGLTAQKPMRGMWMSAKLHLTRSDVADGWREASCCSGACPH